MIEHTRQVYAAWLPIRRNMPRDERFGLGKHIDELFLATLEDMRGATYSAAQQKITKLGNVLQHLDLLRFFLQLAWECKLIEQKHYILLATGIESTGRMVGGWRKGLLAKTPPKGGERKE